MSPAAKPPAACPVCGKPAEAALAPFCSRRCADIDLGRWLKGSYAIPGRPEDDAGAGSEGSPEDGEASES